jgi:hypothetical protein
VDSAMSVSRAMEQGLEQALKGRTLLDLVQEQPALHSVATQQR